MTGSGKTGLGVIALEEALLAGIPILAFDLKGDLANLALVFPDLAPRDFGPWLEPAPPAVRAAPRTLRRRKWPSAGAAVSAVLAWVAATSLPSAARRTSRSTLLALRPVSP